MIHSATNETSFSVKVKLGEEIRRFRFEGLSFKDLLNQITAVYGLNKDVQERLVVQYKDDEDDVISMSSDAEMREAFSVFAGSVLKLDVSLHPTEGEQQTQGVHLSDAPKSQDQGLAALAPAAQLNEPKESKREEKQLAKAQKRLLKQQWKQQWRQQKEARKAEKHLMKAQCQPHGRLIARHVKDVTVVDGTEIPAGTKFTKTWRLRNEGSAWPAGCSLVFVSRNGDNMGGPQSVPLPVEGVVQTGQEVDVSVPLVSPVEPGRYTAYWRLATPEGKKFGQRVWVSIVVPATSSSSSDESLVPPAAPLEEKASAILAMGFATRKPVVMRLLAKHEGDVAKVTEVLAKRMKAFKGCPALYPQPVV